MDLDPKKENGFWTCPVCRNVSNDVILMKTKIDQLLQMMGKISDNYDNLSSSMESLSTSYASLSNSYTELEEKCNSRNEDLSKSRADCDSLREENKRLRDQVSDLSSKMNKATWEHFLRDKKTLLIGDSLVKDIDPDKLVKTDVVALPGAKVGDIMKKLDSNKNSYSRIIISAGTNDCAHDSLDFASLNEEYKTLISKAIDKVGSASEVVISGIIPRSDSIEHQERVETTNASLTALAVDKGVTFIDNDQVFKMKDGSVCDMLFKPDGVHLTNRGVLQLVKNLKIEIKSGNEDDVSKLYKRQGKHNSFKPQQRDFQVKSSSADDADADGDGWQISKPRRRPGWSNQRRYAQNNQGYSYKQGYSAKNMGRSSNNQGYKHAEHSTLCGFCGEDNHREDRCRHGEPVLCFTCGGSGHKSKYHSSY